MNLFSTVLTYPAPSSNYRGESAENRSVIQKITKGRFEYAVISPEAMRNALREVFREMKLPCNRERLHDEEQLAVKFQDYPDPDRYVDDCAPRRRGKEWVV
jgi:CRISPR-associated protein Cst2